MAAKKIALFIDADNISAKFGKQIINTLESRGAIFIRRIYGNWEKSSLHGWNDCIREFALRPVQQTDFVSGKNATDMSLTIDAMDVLHRDNAEIFALVTNDSDFTPLVIRLREGGMKIIGIGNANASNAFRAACTEFIDLNTLAEVKPAQSPPVTEKISPVAVKPPVAEKNSTVQLSLFDDFNVEHEPPPVTANPKVISLDERKLQSERDKKIQLMHDALKDSAAVHANADGFASLNYARQDVRNKNFDFTVRDFGYGQLKDFITAYPKLYETRQDANGQHFLYRCRVGQLKTLPMPIVDNDRLNRFHEVLREAVATNADGAGFADLCYVGSHIAKQSLGFGVKDLGCNSLQKFISAFPNLYELRIDNNKFYLRCRDELDQMHEVLREAVTANADDTGFADLCTVGTFVAQKNLGFGVKDLGCSSLQKFISAFPNLYELRTDDDKTYLRCRTNELDQMHEVLREAVANHADDTGFADLYTVGTFIAQKNLGFGVRDFGYNSLQKFLSAFPSLYELRIDDKTYLRCRTNELDQMHEVLRETAALHEDSDGFVNLWWACDFISGKKNLVNEIKSMTYKDLVEFLNDFPDRYEIRHEQGQDLCYRCRVIKPKPAENKRLQQLHKILRETAQDNRDKTGFVDLTCAGQNIHDKNFSMKGLGYGSLSKFVSAFPKLYEMQTVGKIVRYRCRQSQK